MEEYSFKKNGYNLVIGSPPEHEKLVVYVLINSEHVCYLHKDEGPDKVVVKFYGEPIKTKLYYDVLLEALQEAKKELLK